MVKMTENICELASVSLKNLKFSEFQTISERVNVEVIVESSIGIKVYRILIAVTPPNSNVIVDGVNQGLTPLSVSLRPGPHTIDLGT